MIRNEVEKTLLFKEKNEERIEAGEKILPAFAINLAAYFGWLLRLYRAISSATCKPAHLEYHPQKLRDTLNQTRPTLFKSVVNKLLPNAHVVEQQLEEALGKLRQQIEREAKNRYTKSEVEYRFVQALYFDRFFSLIATLEDVGDKPVYNATRLKRMANEAATHIANTAASPEVQDALQELIRQEKEDRLLVHDSWGAEFWKALSSGESRPTSSAKRC
jgi:hypothetical protein